MGNNLKAIEAEGQIDEQGQLHLDVPLNLNHPKRVRVIILIPDEFEDEISEREWLKGAASSPAFDFLNDPEEDIYTLSDGKPFVAN